MRNLSTKTKEHNKKTEYSKQNHRTSWFQGFHHTNFTPWTMNHLAIWGIVMYAYFSIMLGAMSIVTRVTGLHIGKGTSTLLSFVFVEVFPILLLSSFFSTHHHWLRDWCRFFGQDLKKKWQEILIWGVMFFLLQILLNMSVTSILGNSSPVSSGNTTTFMSDIKQNGFLIIMNLVIAPACEELVFRILLTNIVYRGLIHFVYDKHLQLVVYWLSAAFSAFMFAILHDGLKLSNIVIYMGCALFLQFIQKRTNSLTAPTMIHGLSNLFAVTFDLLL